MVFKRMGWLMLVVTGLSVLPMPSTAQRSSQNRLTASGMEFEWQVRDGRLHGRLSGPTEGWILVGFNHAGEGLSGARLVFLAVDSEGVVTAEEHIADPPNHERRPTRGADDVVHVQSIRERLGRTEARFSIPLAPGHRESVTLRAGGEYDVILAYSTSDDVEHHSRMRQHRRTRL